VSAFPINSALEAAVIANADEDTPRLVYADWLDENGDPDRAAFIRVQCRLADMPLSDPDCADLIEQQYELAALLKPRRLGRALGEADHFYFGDDLLDGFEEPFRRGFPHFIHCHTWGHYWTSTETERVIAELTRLVRTSSIRGFASHEVPPDRLAQLLAAPVAGELTGLAVGPPRESSVTSWTDTATEFCRTVALCPALRRVRQLHLWSGEPPVAVPAGVAALAKAESLDAVRELTIAGLDAPKAELKNLMRAEWFGRLHEFRSHLYNPAVAGTVIHGLGDLPDLRGLQLPDFSGDALAELAAGKFRTLDGLLYGGHLDRTSAAVLATARFPRLVLFNAAECKLKNEGLLSLLKADWFARLQTLILPASELGDKGMIALAAHPVTRSLRTLHLGDNAFGKAGLSALAKAEALPMLTTLGLPCYSEHKPVQADVVAFVSSLRLPRLRHLNLHGLPLGSTGAKALAASPAFGRLTRLVLSSCGIGDAGAKALFASPHLQNLVELHLDDNKIRIGADALADSSPEQQQDPAEISREDLPRRLVRVCLSG
jgi:uncharacterized protein (TIGR02996 family)